MKLGQSAFLKGGFAVWAALSGGCGDDSSVLLHGTIKFEFDRSEAEESSPYPGTEIVNVSADYSACLRNFYAENPNWQQNGVDGESVFAGYDGGGEGWMDRLCDNPPQGHVECEVMELDQAAGNLRVQFRMLSENIERRFVRFGPLPTESLAGCLPEIDTTGRGMQAVTGADSGENRIWETSTINPQGGATNQGGGLRVSAALID